MCLRRSACSLWFVCVLALRCARMRDLLVGLFAMHETPAAAAVVCLLACSDVSRFFCLFPFFVFTDRGLGPLWFWHDGNDGGEFD